ncbi:hypothetical protein GWI33_021261 [Rhynchophorus ferrugineus]|uniref:Uncharacterized protein n=1 Tax=Rhynchophorus ferrugineus TaxID=354439 RepID=A0A834HQS3_RHYFE|nr:hypothetical protein GWI33_021261 [Rhynchophorus ferrugineus]
MVREQDLSAPTTPVTADRWCGPSASVSPKNSSASFSVVLQSSSYAGTDKRQAVRPNAHPRHLTPSRSTQPGVHSAVDARCITSAPVTWSNFFSSVQFNPKQFLLTKNITTISVFSTFSRSLWCLMLVKVIGDTFGLNVFGYL